MCLCPYREGDFGHRDRHARGAHQVKVEAELTTMHLQAKEPTDCQKPPAARAEARSRVPATVRRNLDLDFQPPGL